jgi:hypothetical protein
VSKAHNHLLLGRVSRPLAHDLLDDTHDAYPLNLVNAVFASFVLHALEQAAVCPQYSVTSHASLKALSMLLPCLDKQHSGVAGHCRADAETGNSDYQIHLCQQAEQTF